MQDAQEKQYKRMTETPVFQLIVALGVPTVISMLITNIYNMADTYFVGTLGTSASGATGIVFSLMTIIQAFGFMYGQGAGSNISRQLGSKNLDAARVFASTAFWCSIITGAFVTIGGLLFMDPLMKLMGSTDTILPFARTYAYFILLSAPALTSSCVMNNILRYEGKAFYAMIGLTSGGILNIFGDALFIRVFHMGIEGAGLSTAISQYISFVILMLPYVQGKTQSSLNVKYFTNKLSIISNICMTGFPTMVRQGLGSIGSMVVNHCAIPYGDAAIAAVSIVNRISNFIFCVAIGIGQGFQPVSSFNYGAKKYSRVKEGFYVSLKMGAALMLVFSIIAYFNAGSLVRFFRDDPSVTAIGTVVMRYQCFALVIMPVSLYANMLFQSIGKGLHATFISMLRSGLILIPMVMILTNFFGLKGLQCAQSASDLISSLISVPFVISFLKYLPEDGRDSV